MNALVFPSGHIPLKVPNVKLFSMFGFTAVHLCRKSDIELDKLGRFWLG